MLFPLFLCFWVLLLLLSFAIGGLGKSVDTFVSTFLLNSAVLRAMDFFNRWQTKKALHAGSAFIEGMPRTVTTVWYVCPNELSDLQESQFRTVFIRWTTLLTIGLDWRWLVLLKLCHHCSGRLLHRTFVCCYEHHCCFPECLSRWLLLTLCYVIVLQDEIYTFLLCWRFFFDFFICCFDCVQTPDR